MDSSYDTTWKLSLKQCFTDLCVSELDQLMEWSNTGSSLWYYLKCINVLEVQTIEEEGFSF